MNDPAGQNRSSSDPAAGPVFSDRVHRSTPSAVTGVLLIALVLWMTIDAMATGGGRTPWIAAAVLVLAVPVIIGWTLWPSVRHNPQRLTIRNPLRTITLPWTAVDDVQAGYSVELRAQGRKFQLWAVPVSLRQRKRASVRSQRMAAGGSPYGGGLFGGRGGGRGAMAGGTMDAGGPGLRAALKAQHGGDYGADRPDPTRAWSDRVVDELREAARRAEARAKDAGEPAPTAADVRVRWNWPLIGVPLVGLILLIVLLVS